MKQKQSKYISIWLFLCSIMVIFTVGIGGFTRLSKAGLSITEWNPITGILPPLNEQNWLQEKLKYEATPEHKIFNYGMNMKEFKTLYLIEYMHRLIARLTGLVFIVPFIYFILKRKIFKNTIIKLSITLLIGLLQSITGWYMVKSGLIIEPHVSHYKLALHLLLAFTIFTLLLTQFFDYELKKTEFSIKSNKSTINLVRTILVLIVIQTIFGAFVAGLNAGSIYNTFPLMNGHIIPSDLFFLEPVFLNIFENRTTIQFIHRMLALLILILIVILTIKNINVKTTYVVLFCTLTQITLGITTLLLHIPVTIAVVHQVFSFILFGSVLYFLYCLKI
ncbi:MAG: COX15/CtaA family protein [Wolbachia endosymbiont of Menacanthus eurysternus]|nr:MAG: COX15/CtaA family protein [Wolbachia endosymbiont of Menacanthus eurysternus]